MIPYPGLTVILDTLFVGSIVRRNFPFGGKLRGRGEWEAKRHDAVLPLWSQQRSVEHQIDQHRG